MRFAVIDIGSNTIKLNIYGVCAGRFAETDAVTARAALASYKTDGYLREDGVSVLINVMRELIGICRKKRVKRIFAFATQSLRGISNTAEVLLRIKTETGIDTYLLPGSEEARLGFRSFITVFGNDRSGILADMGGGSTELTVFEGESVIRSVSLPFGSLSLCKEFVSGVVPDKEAVKMIAEKIKKTEAESGFSAECGTLYVTGGTASGAFRLCGLSGSGEAAELTVDDLKKLLGDAQKDPETYEKTVREIMPERFDSIFSGIAAYIAVCELSGVKTVVLSKTTCRYGYAAEIYEKLFRR